MAKIYRVQQSTTEEKEYCVDWTRRLPTGVTVTDITCTHTPPSGNAVTPGKDITAVPITYTYMPAGLLVGAAEHILDVVATTSNPNISPHVRFLITVDY